MGGPSNVSKKSSTRDARGRASSPTETTEIAGLMPDAELDEIERAHPEGLTSAQVVELFHRRGTKISEATFRKYVQLGLLPRSRRVGRKGKHQGSMGLYPATTVRRVNAIKQMMAESFTIEEIQRSFLRWKDEIESLDRGLRALCDGFEQALSAEAEGWTAPRKKQLLREVTEVRRMSEALVERIETLERQVVSPLERAAKARAFSAGASGGASDLL